MQSALREMQAIFTSPTRLLSMALAIVLLTLSGPFGTLDYDLPTRLIYWAFVVVASYTAGQVGAVIAGEAFAKRFQPAPRVAILALAASLPASVVVIIATFVADASTAPNPLVLWFYVFAVCLALVAVMTALDQRTASVPAAEASAPALLERLPRPQRGRLLHIAVSDHYVDVTTDKGTTLVLMRLSDAIKETAPVAGMQVHRSHWVALDAVASATRKNGKPILTLENGTEVPVSRTYLDAVRSAGFFV